MQAQLLAIGGGVVLAAFSVLGLGARTTSGTQFRDKKPWTWADWREEAAVTLWCLNPMSVWRGVFQGYDDVFSAVVMTFASAVWAAAVATGFALVGWGALSLWGSTVIWRDGMTHPVVKTGVRHLPKKPVRWWGSAVIYLQDGSRIESNWNSRGALTVEQAKEAMRAVVKDLVADVGADIATDSGFMMQCR